MTIDIKGLLAEGARRVWRYQRILWWLFFVNALLAAFGVRPGAAQFAAVLDRSQHAQRLATSFDVFAFIELVAKPEIQIGSVNGGATCFALIFFFFSLFLTGGILEAYRAGRKLRTPEFFHACGTFFWRWIRLALWLLVLMIPLVILASILYGWTDQLSNNAPQEGLGFWLLLAGSLALVGLSMVIRLWFDMAQVRTVAEDERAVRRSVARAFRIVRQNFGSLFSIYVLTSSIAWVVLAIALFVWSKIPPHLFGWSVLLLEAVILVWFAIRLWQRASETVWFERWQVAQAMQPSPAVSATPVVLPATAMSQPAG